MNVIARRPWTQDEFLAWAERQEGRFEFDGSQPVAMTGGTANHSRITNNVHAALRSRLRGTPCDHYGPDLGVRTVGTRIRYPDALVTCTRFPGTAKIAPDPVVIFEVVSPTSGGLDHVSKVHEYAAIPSIRCYVIVESDTPGLTVRHREAHASEWSVRTLTSEDTLALAAIGIEIPVSEFYEDITFEAVTAPDLPT